MNKRISIIMGIYNCEDTLPKAIDSILSQTYTNWELIMCDDCSMDNTYQVAEQYVKRYPDKIKLFKNERNSKLPFTLNHCLEHASGFYVARMDADDYSAPDRLEKQLSYLEEHPTINMVGSLMQRFDADGLHDIMRKEEFPDKYALRYKPCFFHATILAYKEVFDTLNGYTVSTRTERGQDYDLWFRFFAQGYKGATLQEPLYFVREDASAVRRRTPVSRLRIFQTQLHGYKLLHYPSWWLWKSAVITLLKCLTPFFVFDIHRHIQAARKHHVR